MTTSTVGTSSRNYSTMDLFLDACPADITATGTNETWIGECYNDSEFDEAAVVDANTTDATHYVELTTASGESFMDDADKLTNALKYDQANGVGNHSTSGYSPPLAQNNSSYFRVNNIQFKMASAAGTNSCLNFGSSSNNITVDNVICELLDSTGSHVVRCNGAGSTITNSLIIANHTGSTNGLYLSGGAVAVNCTVVSPDSNCTGIGIQASGTVDPTAINCCSFGFTTDFTTSAANWHANSNKNASDSTNSPGTNPVDSLTYADQFEGITAAAQDFRLKSGNSLGVGVQDAATGDLDIVGQTRPSSNPHIGAWEFIVGGITIEVPLGPLW